MGIIDFIFLLIIKPARMARWFFIDRTMFAYYYWSRKKKYHEVYMIKIFIITTFLISNERYGGTIYH